MSHQRNPFLTIPGRLLRAAIAVAVFPGMLAAVPTAVGHAAEAPTVRPVRLDPTDPNRRRAGDLVWRGGLEIIHPDDRFGGLSGLHVSADGRLIYAVTDRGSWVSARLEYREGALAGMTDIRIGDLKGRRGERLSGSWRDAESLASDGSGGFLVAFERRHRIWRYPAGRRKHALSRRPKPLETPEQFDRQPGNGGVEALTRLCDERLLAISEKSRAGPGAYHTWLRDANGWSSLNYASTDSFRPTGAATLPNCDVLVLERHFNVLTGVRARILRVAASSIEPGATLHGAPLATLAPPVTVDNMEGIATRRGDNGETLIYLVSDDNFSGLQRTLLLLFELSPDGG